MLRSPHGFLLQRVGLKFQVVPPDTWSTLNMTLHWYLNHFLLGFQFLQRLRPFLLLSHTMLFGAYQLDMKVFSHVCLGKSRHG